MRTITLAIGVSLLCAGCADQAQTPDGDLFLTILSPGPDVGLAPRSQEILRVRCTNEEGQPIAGIHIDFAIFGDPQGSTLSNDSALTTNDGIANVDIRAGATTASFEVHASINDAEPHVFYIQVSSAGFGTLVVKAAAENEDQAFQRLDFLLFANNDCLELLKRSDLPSPLRKRSSDTVEKPITFGALPLDADHSLLVRALDSTQRLRATGCINLRHDLLLPDSEVNVVVRLIGIKPIIEGQYKIINSLTIPPENRPLARMMQPWTDLSNCPNDPAQLLLDCVVDALDDDDPLDCQIQSPSPFAAAIQSERGLLVDSCRRDKTARDTDSIDHTLRESMEGSVERLKKLTQVEQAALDALTHLSIESSLDVTGGPSQFSIAHQLRFCTFHAGKQEARFDLTAVGVAKPRAAPLLGQVDEWQLQIAPHDISLGYGLMVREVLGTLVLTPAGLPGSSNGLAALLTEMITYQDAQGGSLAGCEALEAIVCDAARLGPQCLGQACTAGIEALAAYLDSGFVDLASAKADLRLSGEVLLIANEASRRVTQLGIALNAPGQWTTADLLLGGESIHATGTFVGALVE